MSKRLLWILIFGLAVNASPIGSHAQTPLARDAAASLYQELLNIGRDADFPSLSGPWRLSLPEDHGARCFDSLIVQILHGCHVCDSLT